MTASCGEDRAGGGDGQQAAANSTDEFAIAGDGIRIGAAMDEYRPADPRTGGGGRSEHHGVVGFRPAADRQPEEPDSRSSWRSLLLGASYHYSKSVLVPQP